MLKRRDGAYGVGRRKGGWWKWKVQPFTVDAVMIYAQAGPRPTRVAAHGLHVRGVGRRRARAVREGVLRPDRRRDPRARRVDSPNTVEKFGPVRHVKPEHVFELGFEGIQASPRHKSGVAVRFPRILRWRTDKRRRTPTRSRRLRALMTRAREREGRSSEWFASRGWTPFDVPARGVGRVSRRRERACSRRDGHGQDARGVGRPAAASGSMSRAHERLRRRPMRRRAATRSRARRCACSGSRRCARSPPTPKKRCASRSTISGIPWTLESRTGDTSAGDARATAPPPADRARSPRRNRSSLLLTRDDVARDLRRPPRRRRRRMARADGHEARRAGRARARAAPLTISPRVRTWGLSATIGNLARRARRTARRRQRSARARIVRGVDPKDVVIDALIPPVDRALPVGRAPRHADAAAGRRGDRGRRRARSSSRTRARRRRSGIRRFSPRGRTGRARSRCITARSTGSGANGSRTGCAPEGCAASSRRRRSTSASTSRRSIACCRSAARKASRGCCSARDAADTGPARSSRVTCVPTNALELLEVAAARDGVGAGADRGAPAGRAPARRARAARRHRRARRRIRARTSCSREVRSTRAYAELQRRRMGVGARISHERRRRAARVSRVRAHRARRTAATSSTNDEIARRHRMSIGTIVGDAQIGVQYLRGGVARLRGGIVRRAAQAGRSIRVRRHAARVRARARHEGVGAARAERQGRDPAVGGKPAAAVRRSSRSCCARGSGKPADGVVPRRGDGGAAAAARGAAQVVAHPGAGRAAHRAREDARRMAPVRLSVRGTARARRARRAVRVSAVAASRRSRSRWRRTTTGSSCCRRSSRRSPQRSRRRCSQPGRSARRHPRPRSTRQRWRSGSFASWRAWRGSCFPGFPRSGKTARQLQMSSGLFFDVLRRYDPDEPAAVAGRARSAGASAREHAARRDAAAAGAVDDGRHGSRSGSTPLAFPLVVDRNREQGVVRDRWRDRVRRMQLALEKRGRMSDARRDASSRRRRAARAAGRTRGVLGADAHAARRRPALREGGGVSRGWRSRAARHDDGERCAASTPRSPAPAPSASSSSATSCMRAKGARRETLRALERVARIARGRSTCCSCAATTTSAPAIRRASWRSRCENAPVREAPFVFAHHPARVRRRLRALRSRASGRAPVGAGPAVRAAAVLLVRRATSACCPRSANSPGSPRSTCSRAIAFG